MHESFLSQNISRESKRIFCDLSVGMELENARSLLQITGFLFSARMKTSTKIILSVLFMAYNKSFIDQAPGQDGRILASFFSGVFMHHKNAKRELGQYPAILTN